MKKSVRNALITAVLFLGVACLAFAPFPPLSTWRLKAANYAAMIIEVATTFQDTLNLDGPVIADSSAVLNGTVQALHLTVTGNTVTGGIDATGDISATGELSSADLSLSNTATVSDSVIAGILYTSGKVVSLDSIQGADLYLTGNATSDSLLGTVFNASSKIISDDSVRCVNAKVSTKLTAEDIDVSDDITVFGTVIANSFRIDTTLASGTYNHAYIYTQDVGERTLSVGTVDSAYQFLDASSYGYRTSGDVRVGASGGNPYVTFHQNGFYYIIASGRVKHSKDNARIKWILEDYTSKSELSLAFRANVKTDTAGQYETILFQSMFSRTSGDTVELKMESDSTGTITHEAVVVNVTRIL